MKRTRIKSFVALLLCLCLVFPLFGCGKQVGNYKIVRTLGEESYCIGYRVGDQIALYVDAALHKLTADGTVHNLAMQWLGADNTAMEADEHALESLGKIPRRTLIVGVNESCFPLSYYDGETFAGFDIALAEAVCKTLGWRVKFQAVARSDIYVQLTSGNVDCIWGGMPMDDINLDEKGNEKPMSQQLAVSEPYLENEIVLVMRADSDAKMNGATLMMDSGPQYIDALDRNNLTSRFSEVQRVNGGAPQCFEALNSGQINAILTDSVALAYYTK